jgi:two-component system, OmpR family, sensor kinase
MYRERIKLELLYHDIKGPLAIIETGISALLLKAEKYGPLTAQQQTVLQRILRNTIIAQNLVNDTLEVVRSEPGAIHTRSVKLADLLLDILVEIFDLANVAVSKKIKNGQPLDALKNILSKEDFTFVIDPELWERKVVLDDKKVKQILRNILLNALKFRKRQVLLEVDESDYTISFTITDDGIGIPSIYHDKIFENYFQLEDAEKNGIRGHGLGLAGVLILVEDLGGKLYLESEVDKGAKFTVRLPIVECAPTPS